MKKLFLVPLMILPLLGCGGHYKHYAGNCTLQNGTYQAYVSVYRKTGAPDAGASKILFATCQTAQNKLNRR